MCEDAKEFGGMKTLLTLLSLTLLSCGYIPSEQNRYGGIVSDTSEYIVIKHHGNYKNFKVTVEGVHSDTIGEMVLYVDKKEIHYKITRKNLEK